MLRHLLVRSSEEVRAFSLGTRARRLAVGVLAGVCLVVVFGLDLAAWQTGAATGEPLSAPVRATGHLLVLVGYAALWVLLAHRFRRTETPAHALWTTLLIGALLLGAGWVVLHVESFFLDADALLDEQADEAVRAEFDRYSSCGVGFDCSGGTGVPIALLSVVKMNLLSVLETAFAFVLLLKLRSLVLFRRTKTSVRNWYLLLGLMTVGALLFFMRPSTRTIDSGLVEVLVFPPVVLMMVANSFRHSWIVVLSLREKLLSIGLLVLLLGALIVALVPGGNVLLADGEHYLRHYSYPLYVFTSHFVPIFGVLYATTALLSLLFHLPTTGDFQQKVGEMAAMQSLTTLVGQVFERDRLAEAIARSPVEAGLAHRAWLAAPDPQSGSLRPRILAAYGTAPREVHEALDVEALYDEAQQLGGPLLLNQAPADHRVRVEPGEGMGSLLVQPLVARERFLGALFLTKEVAQGFEQDNVEALGVFATQAALAFENARLLEEQLEKERLERELSIAREVQRKLLPECPPRVQGLSICASSVPAQEVGGDYYDFLELPDGRVAFIVADVSGKGASAAFYMAEMQGVFQSASRLAPAPVDFLSHANDALSDSLERNVFISVVYGLFDPSIEELRLARAGHCPVATINLNGEARYLRSPGLGLGLDRTGRFGSLLREERIALQPGDVFVLYTDGVVESRSADGEEYGYDRLLTALQAHRHEDAADLHDGLLHDLKRFIGHAAYDDDMTMLVMKWQGIDLPAVRPNGVGGRHEPEPPTLTDA